jgi:hypothetical protein
VHKDIEGSCDCTGYTFLADRVQQNSFVASEPSAGENCAKAGGISRGSDKSKSFVQQFWSEPGSRRIAQSPGMYNRQQKRLGLCI